MARIGHFNIYDFTVWINVDLSLLVRKYHCYYIAQYYIICQIHYPMEICRVYIFMTNSSYGLYQIVAATMTLRSPKMRKPIGRWRESISEFDEVNCRSKCTICGKKTRANWQLLLVCTSFIANLQKGVCRNCDQFWLNLVQTWERCLWQLRPVWTSFNANFGKSVSNNCDRFELGEGCFWKMRPVWPSFSANLEKGVYPRTWGKYMVY